VKDLGASDIFDLGLDQPEPVDMPEWGGRVYVRPITCGEFQRLSPRLREEGRDVTVDIVILCACNAAGEPLFTDNDSGRLSRLPVKPLQRIALAAAKLNGLSGDQGKAASPPTPSEGSPTA
jgi:hypothetical protein